MKNLFNKPTDGFIEIFIWVYTIFFCSLAFPLTIGISLLIGEAAQDIYSFGIKHPYVYYGISIAIGICLKFKLDKWHSANNSPSLKI